jgi:predicted metal-dependent hydrolase
MDEIQLPGGITADLEFRRIKIMRLTIYPPDGRVKIAAPLNTPPQAVRDFALSKLPWIEKHREQFRGKSKVSGVLKNGASVWVWGEELSLAITERRGNSKITVDEGIMKMQVRPGAAARKKQEILDRWYRRILAETAPGIIKKWEGRIGVEVKGLYIRKMKSHWGSCNGERQTLRLNSELVKKNPVCLEYVIVHEMIHIIEISHNQRFYKLMNRFIPEWKIIRKKMNKGEL